MNKPGELPIAGSIAPIKAVRIPDEDGSPIDPQPEPGNILGEIHDEPAPITPTKLENLSAENMRVLVAEDDPVNSRIVKKRLERLQHDVYLTPNGEECASAYCDNSQAFDVVLMDMQVSNPSPESISYC